MFHISSNGMLLVPNDLVHTKTKLQGYVAMLLFINGNDWVERIKPSYCLIKRIKTI